jgi:tryptophan synthase alpha chain
MTHLVCWYPDLETSKEIFYILDKKSEYIEIQFPFSDPIADGQVITQANELSVKNWTTVENCFSFIQEVTPQAQSKIIIMTYYNIILRYWVKKFIHRAKSLWIYAFIIPDIPNDESDGIFLIEECKRQNIHFIYIVSPNIWEDRLKEIWTLATGFVYAISNNMTTWSVGKFWDSFVSYISRLKQHISIPIWVWFWVKTKDDIHSVCNISQFWIIWSELINIHKSNWIQWLEKYLDDVVS